MSNAFQRQPVRTEDGGRRGNLVTVTVAQPREIGLVDWMSELRDWFDKHRIEPAGFKQHDGASDNQTYEVSFRDRSEADLFATAFNKKHLR